MSFSKRERHTFLYRDSRKKLLSCSQRSCTVRGAGSVRLFSMALRKRVKYQVSEYWYMGSTLASSVTAKNRMELCAATGTYSRREESILASVWKGGERE